MEIVIILFVVGIMISGIVPLFLNVITVNKSAGYYSDAYKIADSLIEEYRSKHYAEIVSSGTIDLPDLPEGKAVLVVEEELDGLSIEGIKEVNLKVSWNFKKYQEISISTYIADGGIAR